LSQFARLTDRQTERRTEFSSLDCVCIPCSAIKSDSDEQKRSSVFSGENRGDTAELADGDD